MGLHVQEMTRKYVKDSLTGVLASNGYIAQNYRGDLDTETLENIDSLGVYEVAFDLGDELDMTFSDKDLKKMFGSFEMNAETIMNGNRNNVRASDVIDYVSENFVEQRNL